MIKPHALIVDDNTQICLMIQRALDRRMISSCVAHSIDEAKRLIGSAPVVVSVIDVIIPQKDGERTEETGGIQLARWVRDNHPDCYIIFVTGADIGPGGPLAQDAHLAYSVIAKPLDMHRLVREVGDLMFKNTVETRLDSQDQQLSRIIANQKASAKLMKALAAMIPVITPLISALVEWVRRLP